MPKSSKLGIKKPQEFKLSGQKQRLILKQRKQSGIKVVKSTPKVPAKPKSQQVVDFNQKPIEVDGLKIFMFRGDEGIGGFKPLIPPISDSLYQAPYRPAPESPYQQYQVSIPSSPPIRWSQAEVEPVIIPRTSRPEVAPPFPTRHTTRSPLQSEQPIVIIAQSNVAQN